MRSVYQLLSLLLLFPCLYACTSGSDSKNSSTPHLPTSFPFEIQELSDHDYPDNPDIGFRSTQYQNQYFSSGEVVDYANERYALTFYTEGGDTIQIGPIRLDEFIPTIPKAIKSDPYLSGLCITNQEWNRNQVQFKAHEFTTNNPSISRVDIARNCLNAYLWEVIAFTQEDEKDLPLYHGWYQFPKPVYQQLFEAKNGIAFTDYQAPMEQWLTPESKKVNRTRLRTTVSALPVYYQDLSDAMYPVAGARKKKFKEIIFPEQFSTMRDLQNDSTLFATFTPPGFYNRADPRKTQLGRFYQLDTLWAHQTLEPLSSDSLYEFELLFRDQPGERTTKLVIGGLDIHDFPKLSFAKANQGWMNSMGFGNHTFYETYTEHQQWKSSQRMYYAFLADEQDQWLDSHEIGIDGPIFHWDADKPNVLHLWLLSFERHALVGHYTIAFTNS